MTIIINAFSVDPAIATKYEAEIAELMNGRRKAAPEQDEKAIRREELHQSIIALLGDREMTARDISLATGVSSPLIGSALARLKEAGLVVGEVYDRVSIYRRAGIERPRAPAVKLAPIPRDASKTRKLVADGLAAGDTQAQIARRLGMSTATVSHHAQAIRKGESLTWGDQRRADISAMLSEGVSISDVAERLGITKRAVANNIKAIRASYSPQIEGESNGAVGVSE